ncbi:MAG: cysteine desulfurase [Spirochaetales bacterium]|nr:cysteine desulfurase [Spirochaetales bacterium]
MVYLDYSAHTPPDREVMAAFMNTELDNPGNANSPHAYGMQAMELVKSAQNHIRDLMKAPDHEVIFTSGATEANNLAIKGIAESSRHRGKHIVSTPIEHSSVSAPLSYLQEKGWEIDLVRIGRDGKVDLEDLDRLIRDDTVLVTCPYVDGELGTIQPVREMASIIAGHPGCRFHIDATQAFGKTEVLSDIADTLSLSGHKFYGINGSGLLLRRKTVSLVPLLNGGASTTVYRSGTPAAGLAVSLDKAMTAAVEHLEERNRLVSALNSELRSRLSEYRKVLFNSPEDAVPHILNISVGNIKGKDFQQALSARGICVSVKSACSVDNLPSRSVFAISRDRKRALSSWRISLSHLTTTEELNEFMKAFDDCLKELENG